MTHHYLDQADINNTDLDQTNPSQTDFTSLPNQSDMEQNNSG